MLNLTIAALWIPLFAEVPEPLPDYEDGFSPFVALLFFGIILGIICILLGIGIVIGLLFVGTTMALAGLGVIASSSVAGLRTGKISTGVKALILQILAGAGLISGLGLAAVLHVFADLQIRAYLLGIAGAVSGLIGGAILGIGFNALWPRCVAYLKKNIESAALRRG